jgi:hypothetical protein
MSASMRINQAGLSAGSPGISREDGLATGALVTLVSLSHVSTYSFELLWVGQHPTPDLNSVASLTDIGGGSYTFTPTAGVYGSWRIKLTTDVGTEDEHYQIRTFAIKTGADHIRIPAANEYSDPSGSLENTNVESETNHGDGVTGSPQQLESFVTWWRPLADSIHSVNVGRIDSISFTQVVPLTGGTKSMGTYDVSGVLTFTLAALPVAGAACRVRLKANGLHLPDFSAFEEWSGSSGYDNTNGIYNHVYFFEDEGVYFYSVGQAIGQTPITPFFRFGFPGNGTIETGDVNIGWSYEYPTDGFGTKSSGNADKSMVGDGYVQATLQAFGSGSYINLQLAETATPGNASTSKLAIFQNVLGATWRVYDDGANPVANGSAIPTAAGDVVRLQRVGTALTAWISKNGGSTWTLLHTATATSSATLWPRAGVAAPGEGSKWQTMTHVGLA